MDEVVKQKINIADAPRRLPATASGRTRETNIIYLVYPVENNLALMVVSFR